MSSMYNKIHELCKIKNKGLATINGLEPTNRVKYLINLLKENNIEYVLDIFEPNPDSNNKFFNIELKGSSNKMVVAHHDIVNPNSDNANDNSCSVINAIMVKKLRPDMNVVLLDGEEIGGIGAQRCSERINEGVFGSIDWVLNFELTGKGGESFFIGNYPGVLTELILSKFDCPIFNTPFNDSVVFRKNGIDSVVINPLPLTEKPGPIQNSDGKFLEFKLLFNCHSEKDSLSTIDTKDMQDFVEKIVLKILG